MNLPNPNRINLEDPADVLLWADMLSISAERLQEIAARVGPMAAAVRFYANKSGGDVKAGKAARPEGGDSAFPTRIEDPSARDARSFARDL